MPKVSDFSVVVAWDSRAHGVFPVENKTPELAGAQKVRATNSKGHFAALRVGDYIYIQAQTYSQFSAERKKEFDDEKANQDKIKVLEVERKSDLQGLLNKLKVGDLSLTEINKLLKLERKL